MNFVYRVNKSVMGFLLYIALRWWLVTETHHKFFYCVGREFTFNATMCYFWFAPAYAFACVCVFFHDKISAQTKKNKWINQILMIIRFESRTEIEKQCLQIEFPLSIIDTAHNVCVFFSLYKCMNCQKWCNRMSNKPLNSFQICISKWKNLWLECIFVEQWQWQCQVSIHIDQKCHQKNVQCIHMWHLAVSQSAIKSSSQISTAIHFHMSANLNLFGQVFSAMHVFLCMHKICNKCSAMKHSKRKSKRKKETETSTNNVAQKWMRTVRWIWVYGDRCHSSMSFSCIIIFFYWIVCHKMPGREKRMKW